MAIRYFRVCDVEASLGLRHDRRQSLESHSQIYITFADEIKAIVKKVGPQTRNDAFNSRKCRVKVDRLLRRLGPKLWSDAEVRPWLNRAGTESYDEDLYWSNRAHRERIRDDIMQLVALKCQMFRSASNRKSSTLPEAMRLDNLAIDSSKALLPEDSHSTSGGLSVASDTPMITRTGHAQRVRETASSQHAARQDRDVVNGTADTSAGVEDPVHEQENGTMDVADVPGVESNESSAQEQALSPRPAVSTPSLPSQVAEDRTDGGQDRDSRSFSPSMKAAEELGEPEAPWPLRDSPEGSPPMLSEGSDHLVDVTPIPKDNTIATRTESAAVAGSRPRAAQTEERPTKNSAAQLNVTMRIDWNDEGTPATLLQLEQHDSVQGFMTSLRKWTPLKLRAKNENRIESVEVVVSPDSHIVSPWPLDCTIANDFTGLPNLDNLYRVLLKQKTEETIGLGVKIFWSK